MENTNLEIVKRLLELSRNQLEYSLFPKNFKEEHIFLPNVLNIAMTHYQQQFDKAFREAVGEYKSKLSEGKYGWFHKPEELVWLRMEMNQIRYAIYGSTLTEIKFNKSLGESAYKDLIEQIDRTVLMTPKELEAFWAEINEISKQVIAEIEQEQKGNK
jgi:hypothetical protein